MSEENSDYATARWGRGSFDVPALERRLRGRKIDENRARQETRRWTPTGPAGVAREERMEEDEGAGRWEGVAHARVG